MAQNALIVKSRFQFKGSGLFGVMALIFDANKKIMVEEYVFVSRFSEIFLIDIKAPWHFLEIQLNRIQMQGTYAASVTSEFQRSIRDRLDPNYGIASGIVVDYELRNREKIHSALEEMLTFVQKDKGISMEVAYELADLDAIQAARAARAEEEARVMGEEATNIEPLPVNIDQGTILIPANPVLSPIKGVAAAEIVPGIQILMKLDLTLPQGTLWGQIFRAFDPETKEPLPLVSTVRQAGPVINKCRDILVGYGENRITRFNIEASIKLKTYDVLSKEKVIHPHLLGAPAEDSQFVNPKKLENFLFQSILPWIIFGAVALCAIILIFVLVFSF